MNYLVLFLKGLIIGAGKIIPGVSGSILALSLHVYDDAIYNIENIFKNFKKSVKYLFPLFLGILTTIVLFSKIIIFFISTNYSPTISIIIGLILGTIPNYIRNIKIKYKSFIYLAILFLLFTILYRVKITLNMNYFTYFILGIVEAFTSITPGISSTAIYMNFNIYNCFLNIFSNPVSFNFFIFSTGIIIGVFYTSKLINYLLKKYRYETNIVIIALMFSSTFSIIKYTSFNILNIILIMLGFVISYMFDK